MGKIFGISDLPVSTIMTPFEPVYKSTKQPSPKVPKVVDVFEKKVNSRNVASKIKQAFKNFIKHK